jgi:hypothetical protein
MATSEAIYTWATYRNISLGTTGQVIKSTTGQVGGCYLFNNASSARFVKLGNQATVPDQTATPLLTIQLPAGGGANLVAVAGIDFTTGISARATTGVADNDTGAPSAVIVPVSRFRLFYLAAPRPMLAAVRCFPAGHGPPPVAP